MPVENKTCKEDYSCSCRSGSFCIYKCAMSGWLLIQFFLGVLWILGFCDAETVQGAYSVPYGSQCCMWLLHAMGAAPGKRSQVDVQGWGSTCDVMWVQAGRLESGTPVSNVCLCFCCSSGPKFNSAIRGKIGLPHSIKLRFLHFLYLFLHH